MLDQVELRVGVRSTVATDGREGGNMGLIQRFTEWRDKQQKRQADQQFERLLDQLESSDVINAIGAIGALERMGERRAIPVLVGKLHVPIVNHDAARALVTLGWRPEEPRDAAAFHAVYWSGDRFDATAVRRLAAEGHGSLVSETLAREVSRCSNHYCKERAAKLIGEVGAVTDDVLRTLIAQIWLGNSGDENVQIACADTLGKIGDERVISDLERSPFEFGRGRHWSQTAAAVQRAVEALRKRGAKIALNPGSAEASTLRDNFKVEILRFLTSARTKDREQRTGDWWSHDDLKLVVAKTFSEAIDAEVLFHEAEAAIDELAKEGRISGTPSGYRSA